MEELVALALVVVANGAPVVLHDLLGARFAWPLDGGRRAPDGRPWLGPSKTLRGVLVAVSCAAVAAPLLGRAWWVGAGVGLLAMAGDVAASFCKRRLGIAPSGRALGLDQIPESLLPAAVLSGPLGLDWPGVLMVTAAFFALDVTVSPILYRIGIRQRPY
jgi:CDP-2,3-bis-(O-geranylgeranyl)-sn-glycerol synthase